MKTIDRNRYGITYNFDSNSNPYTWLNILAKKYHKPFVLNEFGNYIHGSGLEIYISYISAYYFVLTSYTTVGFGNISPNTAIETFLSIFLLFIGCNLFVRVILILKC